MSWQEERIDWYMKKIEKLVVESLLLTGEEPRFAEIEREVNNYQSEINRLKGGV